MRNKETLAGLALGAIVMAWLFWPADDPTPAPPAQSLEAPVLEPPRWVEPPPVDSQLADSTMALDQTRASDSTDPTLALDPTSAGVSSRATETHDKSGPSRHRGGFRDSPKIETPRTNLNLQSEISGRVTDESGQGLPGLEVEASVWGSLGGGRMTQRSHRGTSGENGDFRIPLMAESEAELSVDDTRGEWVQDSAYRAPDA